MATLYHVPTSRSLRVLWTLEEIGATVEVKSLGTRPRLHEPEYLAINPAGTLPALIDGDRAIYESLAICEYVAERHPGLWPERADARALARAAAAEMHSGFQALRAECPMALEAAPGKPELSEATQKNIGRIVTLWSEMLDRFGGPYLAGRWSIADAFYTPVASRFETYGVDLTDYGDSGAAAAYGARLLQTPEYLAWKADALA